MEKELEMELEKLSQVEKREEMAGEQLVSKKKNTNKKAMKGKCELLLLLINASRWYYYEKRLQSSHLNQRPWGATGPIHKTCNRMTRI